MSDSGALWGSAMAKFIRENWLVFLLLTGGAVWATDVNSDLRLVRERRQDIIQEVRDMNDRLIEVQADVAYIRGQLDAVVEE